MKIYFAGSIRGGRELQADYAAIVNSLAANGHIVLTEHVASPTLSEDEQNQTDSAIYTQDIQWLDQADVVVAEVSVPSLGVGYEIGYALHVHRIPVLCLCREGVPLSAMLVGNPDSQLHIRFYGDTDEANDLLTRFLKEHRKR